MYDELIKMLRTCSERDSCIGWKEACPYLGTGVCDNKAEKAADAIEELQKRVPPVPHGRLIDGDKLAEEQKENVRAYHANLITLDDLAECLLKQSISEDGAPTIIPASEESE